MPLTTSAYAAFSVDNSTTKPLAANASFVGKWEEVAQFAILYSLWRTDAPGTLFYQFSIDGTQVDRTFPIETTDFVDGMYTSTGPRGRFFRIRYVNGPQPQNWMRLQTTYSTVKSDDAHGSVNVGISPKATSLVTRSVVYGQTSSSSFVPIRVAQDGSLPISVSSTPALTQSPVMKTNKIRVNTTEADQVILSYTPTVPLSLYGFSTYVWDTMTSSQVFFGEASLESPAGTKLYTSQLSSIGQGKESVQFSSPLVFPANQTVRIVCSPSAPINEQTWQANLIGAS